MFNVAVPDIARDYSLNPTDVSWVITGYVALFALGALSFGKLADRYPVRRLILVGLALFNAGALMGFFSTSYSQLVVARLIQATGGSSIPALGMLTATRFVPADRRGRVLGAIAATVALAAGIGPMLGGYLGGFWHWRYLFLVSLITLTTLPAYVVLLPHEKPGGSPYDLFGAALTSLTFGGLLLFVAENSWPSLMVSMLTTYWLVRHLRRSKHPFLPLQLMSDRSYILALLTTFFAIGTVFGMMFLLPILLRELHHLPTLKIGLTIFPGAITASVMGLLAGLLADRLSPLRVVRIGLPVLGCGYFLLTLFADSTVFVLVLILMICYTGFAFIHSSLAKTVSLILPHAITGVGMGFYNLVFFLSGAFGTAIASRLQEALRAQLGFLSWVDDAARPFSGTFFCMLCTVIFAFMIARNIPQPEAGHRDSLKPAE